MVVSKFYFPPPKKRSRVVKQRFSSTKRENQIPWKKTERNWISRHETPILVLEADKPRLCRHRWSTAWLMAISRPSPSPWKKKGTKGGPRCPYDISNDGAATIVMNRTRNASRVYREITKSSRKHSGFLTRNLSTSQIAGVIVDKITPYHSSVHQYFQECVDDILQELARTRVSWITRVIRERLGVKRWPRYNGPPRWISRHHEVSIIFRISPQYIR